LEEKRRRWPVIDTHCHVGVNSLITFIAEEELIPWMDKYHIDIQICFQVNEGFYHRTPEWNPYVGNDYVAKIQKMFPGRVIGLATINPWLQPPSTYGPESKNAGKKFDLIRVNPALEEIERAIGELGLWGLKMHPLEHNYAINNPKIIFPVMDKLVEMQERTGRKLLIVVHAMGDSLNNSPEALADVARRYPQLLFIMAHSGFVWAYGTVAHMLVDLPNVMFDLTTCPQKSVVYEAYEKVGARRFTAGSDAPFASPVIKEAIVRDLARNEEEVELILGGNIAQYLGIPPIEE
jgi:hypothetical protein